ncbi:hypothetical protein FIM02_00785 [SAR202 cluster bacterium AD-802-E10_MRT_200m]|nr:hypothetical protein [SAR202 cluster bacterium AD-802-E10_MRT_200m]
MNEEGPVTGTVQEELIQLRISYEIIHCRPEFADTTAFCEQYGYPEKNSGNTIIVAGKSEPKKYAACVVSAIARLDVNRTVKRLLEVRRVSFASPEETQEVTRMKIGGVTVFGLPANIPIYMDPNLRELDYVILGSGSRYGKLKLSPVELEKIPNAMYVDGLANIVAY